MSFCLSGVQVVRMIRGAANAADAAAQLCAALALSAEQAEGVLNMSLRRLTSLEEQKLREEDEQLTAKCVDRQTDRQMPDTSCTRRTSG
jgi:DNA gyrase subunit A